MITSARPKIAEGSAHWYYQDGRPAYSFPKKDGSGDTPTTLRHAREHNLLPSVTTILKVLDKPGLVNWRIEQAILAVTTSPQRPGEPLDTFIDRIINVEMEQDRERDQAASRGTAIHDGCEKWFLGQKDKIPEWVLPWITPACQEIEKLGELVACEKVLVGEHVAGRCDLIQRSKCCWHLWDWKHSRTLPDKEPWPEHRLQLSAYANIFFDSLPGDYATGFDSLCRNIHAGNVYISSVNQGEFVVFEIGDWWPIYRDGFRPLVTHWQWANNYVPQPQQSLT